MMNSFLPIRMALLVIGFIGFQYVAESAGVSAQMRTSTTTVSRTPQPFVTDPNVNKSIPEIRDMLLKWLPKEYNTTWTCTRMDEQPTIRVEGNAGYRIVMQKATRYEKNPQQMAGIGIKHSPEDYFVKNSHVELALFPAGDGIRESIKDKIPWQDLEQEYHVRPVAMGSGHGYAWYGQIEIKLQDDMRNDLGLNGGEDPLRLAIAGLKVNDHQHTPPRMRDIFEKSGSASIPYLESLARDQNEKMEYRCNALDILGLIPGDKSTEILREFYRNDEFSRAAAAGFLHRPLRVSEKEIYLDILRKQYDNYLSIRVCDQTGWSEAIPILQELYRHPKNCHDSRMLFEAKRRLEGNPIPASLIEAEETFRRADYGRPTKPSADDLKKAVDVFGSCPDRESAMVVAVSMILARTKGSLEITNSSGQAILSLFPPEMVKSYLKDLSESSDDYNKKDIDKILAENFGSAE